MLSTRSWYSKITLISDYLELGVGEDDEWVQDFFGRDENVLKLMG